MAILNATHGELRWNGAKIAKVTNVTLDVSREALETTALGDRDSNYSYGRRTTSGSATLLYKTDDASTTSLLNRIFDDSVDDSSDLLTIVLRTGSSQGTITGTVLITQTSTQVSVGSTTSVNINFSVSGKPDGIY